MNKIGCIFIFLVTKNYFNHKAFDKFIYNFSKAKVFFGPNIFSCHSRPINKKVQGANM